MKKIFTFLVLLQLYVQINAQSSLFFKTIGSSSGYEEIESVTQSADFTIVSAGGSDSFTTDGNSDALIIKTDTTGNIIWSKTYGDKFDNMATDIESTVDTGSIFVGWTKTAANDYDFWIVKIDKNGNLQWEKRYGASGNEQAWKVVVGNDAYWVIGGTTSFGAGLSDIWILKLNLNGVIVWQTVYGTTGDDAPPGKYEEYVASGFMDSHGRLVVSGTSNGLGNGDTDILTIKINADNGSLIWQYVYGDIDDESLWNPLPSFDKNYYFFAGNMIDPNTSEGDLWIVKTDTTGTIVWQKIFGVNGKWDETINSTPTNNGVLLASYYETNNDDWTSTLINVDNNGNLLWANEYKAGDLDWSNDIIQLTDGNIILAGVTTNITTWDEDYLYVKADSKGNIASCNKINSFTPNEKTTNLSKKTINISTETTSVSELSISTTTNDISLDNVDICSTATYIDKRTNEEKTYVIPNPAGNYINITNNNNYDNINIYNISGKLIYSKANINTEIIDIDISAWKQGIYFIILKNNKTNNSTKLKFIKQN